MPPIQPCSIPYMGTNCTQTYQQAAGSAYTTYQGIFLSCALVLFILITLQNIRLFRIRGCLRQHYTHTSSGSVPHQLFALSWFINATLVIRGTDPHGWAAHVPQWLEEFCLAMATSCAYNTLLIAVMNWIKIIHSISGRSPARVFGIQRILFVLMVIWHLFFSTLYSAAKPAFLFSCFSLAFNCIFNIVVIAMGWFYGFRIYRHLSRYSSSSASSSSFSSASPSTSGCRPSVSQKNTSTDRARVRIIIHLLIAMTILSIVAVAVQLLTIRENIRTQYQTAHDAFDYPTFTLGNILLTYGSFPIAQGVNVVIVLIFFRKLGSDSSSSRGMDTEKSSRASSQKTTKTRTRNSTSMTRADATAVVAAAATAAGGVKGGMAQAQAQSYNKSEEKEKGQSTMPRHSNSSALLLTRQTSESIVSVNALLPSHVHIPSSPSLIHHAHVIEPTPLHPHGIDDASHPTSQVDGRDVALDIRQHVNIEIQTI